MTPEEQIELMKALMVHPGWEFLVKTIKEGRIAQTQKELEEMEFATAEEFKNHQLKLKGLRELIEMPLDIIDALTPSEEEDSDPYDTVDESVGGGK